MMTSASRGWLPPLAKRIDRATRWLRATPGAVQGQQGSNRTFAAAQALVNGFCLDEHTALMLLLDIYNPKCVPPWSKSELQHKVTDAFNKPCNKSRGWFFHV